MKVVIKRPHEGLEVIDVPDLKEINKLLGNIGRDGEACSDTGSDFRQEVFDGIDMHMNGNAVFNPELPENFWDVNGNRLYCGNVIFAGYDPGCGNPFGVCSLDDAQIEYLKNNIRRYYDIV